MAIGDLGANISSSDMNRVRVKNDPDAMKEGYEQESVSDDDIASFFDDDDVLGMGGDDGDFGLGFGNEDNFGGGNDIFGGGDNSGNSIAGGQAPGQFGGFGQQQQQQLTQHKPDLMDKTFDIAQDTAVNLFSILKDLCLSIKERNCDDIGYYGRNLIITGMGCAGVGIILMILGAAAKVPMLGPFGIGYTSLFTGLFTMGMGLATISLAAMILSKGNGTINMSVEDIPDASQDFGDSSLNELEDSCGDIFDDIADDLFSDDTLDSIMSDDLEDEDSNNDLLDISGSEDVMDFTIDMTPERMNEALDNIQGNRLITREILVNTFAPLLPTNTKEFNKRETIDKDSDEFVALSTICYKALANVSKLEIEDIKSVLESAIETFFSYELKLTRMKGLNKTDDIARELEVYFRSNSKDFGVTATVDLEGDFYKIVVTKGVSPVVTFGDCFKEKCVMDFFMSEDNKLPIITGIDELGNIILDDAKIFDTMMIAGKPRSGKSWYVLSILWSLMAFNTPEDCTLLIIDPKESNLFKTISLMPHVMGLHNDDNILEVLEDVINIEAPRRKKLLSDNRCENLWELRAKGIMVPVLYIIIDEYLTVTKNLELKDKTLKKQFDNYIQIIISQLPSLGVRLIFVPHRATGIVDKTNRTMIQFAGAVKLNIDEVKDTLGIAKWTKGLVNPGDIAIKTASREDPFFVRGAALTIKDQTNTQFIELAAKAFYKMGVDIPDFSYLDVACNRNEADIMDRLNSNSGDSKRVQYDANNIFNDFG